MKNQRFWVWERLSRIMGVGLTAESDRDEDVHVVEGGLQEPL